MTWVVSAPISVVNSDTRQARSPSCQLEVEDVPLELGDALLELIDVDGVAEPGGAPGLFAQQLGETCFELVDVGGLSLLAVLRAGEIGLQ